MIYTFLSQRSFKLVLCVKPWLLPRLFYNWKINISSMKDVAEGDKLICHETTKLLEF